jgi:hypothetical protein
MSSIEYLEGIPVSNESQVDRVHLLQPRVMIATLFACHSAVHVVLWQNSLPIAKPAVSDMFDNLDRTRGDCHAASQHIEENHQVGRFFRTIPDA